jgi:hypothetical protein
LASICTLETKKKKWALFNIHMHTGNENWALTTITNREQPRPLATGKEKWALMTTTNR